MNRGKYLATLSFLFFAVAGARADSLRLEYQFQAGEQLRYLFSQKGKTVLRFLDGDTDSQELDVAATVVNLQTVKEVDRSRKATVTMEFRDGSVVATLPNKRFEMPFSLPEMTLKMAPNGAVLSTETVKTSDRTKRKGQDVLTGISANSLNLCQFFGQMSALSFPSKKLEIGDTWSRTSRFTSPFGESTMVAAHSKLLGLKVVRGQQCAEIATNATFPMEATMQLLDALTTVEGTYELRTVHRFSIERGRLISLEGTAHVQQMITLDIQDPNTREKTTSRIDADSNVQFSMELQESA
ncbi:MAG: hypothetical protein AUJ92_07000 [Armatimonadetes bacterium CG2_30_59_28]|nr:hypothetical protein [Armatimonadota bacterium]OIO95998.1 MAG: hypothetical protein AUJ92_07000 [Armatimonadetes bacterium CG2_30_59_28]PIU67281.1 MAG: hypothetical protein COS85_01320 [Armatimonadetes bacterium CG07_land_8_20_14_0_80_59_28]PJB72622.1 MAG: hypothetical protein CO095_06690 [Armatimonadetes bacterium CG_4_9_14_3_um_filter_58_7]